MDCHDAEQRSGRARLLLRIAFTQITAACTPNFTASVSLRGPVLGCRSRAGSCTLCNDLL